MELIVGKVFRRLHEMIKTDKKYLVMRGGTSSGKSFAVLQYLMLYALQNKGKRINIITESMIKAKRTIIPDFRKIIKEINKHVVYNKSESYFTFPNDTVISFISGDDIAKVVGIRSDVLYIDEVNTVKKEVLDELEMRTRFKVIASFNPHSIWDWYEEVSQKESFLEDVSNYLDNPFLEKSIIIDILDRARRSVRYQQIHIDGEFGNADGLVFVEDKEWFIIDELPLEKDIEIFTLDFGFRHNTGVLKIYKIDNDLYVQEMLYKNDMITSVLAQELKELNPLNKLLICDSEDQQQIENLKRTYGIRAKGIKKRQRNDSIDNLKTRNVFITKDSINLIKEMRNYHYSKKKKDSKQRPLPEKLFDDLIDPLRYGCDHLFVSRGGSVKIL